MAVGVFGTGMGGTAISALTTVKLVGAHGIPAPFLVAAVALAVYGARRRAGAAGRAGPSGADRTVLARLAATLG